MTELRETTEYRLKTDLRIYRLAKFLQSEGVGPESAAAVGRELEELSSICPICDGTGHAPSGDAPLGDDLSLHAHACPHCLGDGRRPQSKEQFQQQYGLRL